MLDENMRDKVSEKIKETIVTEKFNYTKILIVIICVMINCQIILLI